jgi:very-short-patch-repair endonuclease
MPVATARKLRKQQTPAERRLWQLLCDKRLAGYKFRRQFPIGNYITDFACFQHRLVVEADGSQHAENPMDAERTAYLESQGWHVLRFWNGEILKNSEGVLLTVLAELQRP